MTETTIEAANPGDVQRTTTGLGAKPSKSRSKSASPVQAVLWALVLGGGLAAVAPMVQAASSEMRDQLLLQADTAGVNAALRQPLQTGASADYFETLGEFALDVSPADLPAARAAAERAVAADPSRAHAWAALAYFEYLGSAGAATPKAVDAIAKSMAACPLCDHSLIRWRFNFILANWARFPDELRRQAFEQADLLRWAGAPEDVDFLAEMRTKANAAGLPYDEYRGAVATPVRTWELGG
jgi:hypothetical protein